VEGESLGVPLGRSSQADLHHAAVRVHATQVGHQHLNHYSVAMRRKNKQKKEKSRIYPTSYFSKNLYLIFEVLSRLKSENNIFNIKNCSVLNYP
jgi:hypothetical protein